MDQIWFDTRRPRPERLANKNCCYSNDRVHAIDVKDLNALEWTDFEVIFTISGCTAEYDQQVYYLPSALNCLFHQAYDGIEFLPGVIYFASRNADRLQTDGLLEATSGAEISAADPGELSDRARRQLSELEPHRIAAAREAFAASA